jgi:hypothetical protein
MKKIVTWLFSHLGYVPREWLAASSARTNAHAVTIRSLQDERASTQVRLEQEAERVRAANSERDEAAREMQRQRWQIPSLASLPSIPEVPQTIHVRTLDCARVLQTDVKSPLDFCLPNAFDKNEDLRVLYWSLAHASAAAHRAASRLSDENEVSTEFLNALTSELASQRLNGSTSSIRIGVNKIFGNVSPALKEKRVGADFLLLISGDALIPDGGVRLFWIQAKRSSLIDPYLLDIYRRRNADGLSQLDALSYVNKPLNGSFALYTQYSDIISLVLSVWFSNLGSIDPDDQAQCKIRLDAYGYRLQELLSALSVARSPQTGQFGDADSLLAFLDDATKHAIVPLKVLSLRGGSERIAQHTIEQLAARYDQRLAQYRSELYPQIGFQQIQDAGRDIEPPLLG